MTKADIVEIIAEKTGFTAKDVKIMIEQFLDEVKGCLGESKHLEIRGFGSFSLHYRPPRKAHNPKTGERVNTEAKHTPHFKPGKELRDRVNENRQTHPIKTLAPSEDDED